MASSSHRAAAPVGVPTQRRRASRAKRDPPSASLDAAVGPPPARGVVLALPRQAIDEGAQRAVVERLEVHVGRHRRESQSWFLWQAMLMASCFARS